MTFNDLQGLTLFCKKICIFIMLAFIESFNKISAEKNMAKIPKLRIFVRHRRNNIHKISI